MSIPVNLGVPVGTTHFSGLNLMDHFQENLLFVLIWQYSDLSFPFGK